MSLWSTYRHWRPEFAKAIDEALYPLAWLDNQVAHGLVRLLAIPTAGILYEYKQYPSGAWQVEGLVAAGDAQAIVDVLIPHVEEEAARLGAVAAQIASRPGWARLLRRSEYAPYQTTIRKVLASKNQIG
jgi:hypothetical protein